jgi:DNA-binding NarL/FixJ family response regulator
LIDLPCETLARLTSVLEAHEHTVAASGEPADAIFCSAGQLTSDGVRRMVAAHDPAPVIVVTGPAETGQWLDAMDHGAANYCSEPIEESEILFTLASALCALDRPVCLNPPSPSALPAPHQPSPAPAVPKAGAGMRP